MYLWTWQLNRPELGGLTYGTNWLDNVGQFTSISSFIRTRKGIIANYVCAVSHKIMSFKQLGI